MHLPAIDAATPSTQRCRRHHSLLRISHHHRHRRHLHPRLCRHSQTDAVRSTPPPRRHTTSSTKKKSERQRRRGNGHRLSLDGSLLPELSFLLSLSSKLNLSCWLAP
ncbi:hypothetical protein ACE6H2_011475 [Prunus campanulata]